jgi:hypothetical protein
MTLEELLNEGRRALQVTPKELEEARRRRQLLVTALTDVFPDGRHYFNGSVPSGDANTPLTDIDLGIVVDSPGYGPEGAGPLALMEAAREGIRDHLKDEFDNLVVIVEGQKRAVLSRFGEPVTPGERDFTADVIVALNHPSSAGLWIPNTKIAEGWDRADPERHIELIAAANDETDGGFARTIRLLKHWCKTHGSVMCSWNIKALALGCIADRPRPLLEALEVYYTYAAAELGTGLTDDPAGVAGKIKLPSGVTLADATGRLRAARDKVREAIEHEQAGRTALAQHAMHTVLPAVVADSDNKQQLAEQARVVTSASTVGVYQPRPVTPARAWSPR